uniref:DUF659 domain-containing protein n=1 Tax=Glycine max TaxID=3847 RepID=A0A0R0HR85_SOYBN
MKQNIEDNKRKNKKRRINEEHDFCSPSEEWCDLAIAKWFIDASISFNVANSTYFHPMIDALYSMSPRYKVSSMHCLRDDYFFIWKKKTGCTLMVDGWIDRKKTTLINFLVSCPKGTIFLKSVDVSHASKSGDLLFKLFKDVVLRVGPENVVHIVTDNVANCVSTSRKYTIGREILHPSPTRFTTNFIALQSILAQKDILRVMVTSQDWTSSTYGKEVKTKKFMEQVLESGFWSKCVDVVKLLERLVRVLRMVDTQDKPVMHFLCRAMYKAREEMVKRLQRNKIKVEPYLKILYHRWDSQLHKNFHATSYYWILEDKLLWMNEIQSCQLVIRILSQTCSASGYEWNWSRQQNYDPINLETLDDHVDWVMEDSPLFLTNEEVDALGKVLANMTIQSLSNNIGPLNLDDHVGETQGNPMENMNLNESNIDHEVTMGDSSEFFNE